MRRKQISDQCYVKNTKINYSRNPEHDADGEERSFSALISASAEMHTEFQVLDTVLLLSIGSTARQARCLAHSWLHLDKLLCELRNPTVATFFTTIMQAPSMT
uniref:Uncharacterized protein n=1 Tax=Capitella teleta TaxID=283909 RepID=X1ZM28_CAPTE